MTENKLKINEYTFNDQFYNYLIEYSREADYKWGETEFVLQTGYLAGTPVKPSAMIHEIDPSSEVHKHVDGRIKELYPELTGYEPMRMYINCFAPREYSNFHTDGNCKTILVYLADRPWDPSFCGENMSRIIHVTTDPITKFWIYRSFIKAYKIFVLWFHWKSYG